MGGEGVIGGRGVMVEEVEEERERKKRVSDRRDSFADEGRR